MKTLCTKKSPQVGFEPTTNRLTVDRSATELLRNLQIIKLNQKPNFQKSKLVMS
jgi:hypothetical protein